MLLNQQIEEIKDKNTDEKKLDQGFYNYTEMSPTGTPELHVLHPLHTRDRLRSSLHKIQSSRTELFAPNTQQKLMKDSEKKQMSDELENTQPNI